jgi:hypothetical protein
VSARTLPEKYRPARDIRPGWQVRCDGDEWVTVRGWFRYDHPTKPSIVELVFDDGSRGRSWASDELLTRKVKGRAADAAEGEGE